MGYATCISACGSCGRVFGYHPTFVPSLNNVAFCEGCMKIANAQRVASGIEPHPIHPRAYDVADEMEI